MKFDRTQHLIIIVVVLTMGVANMLLTAAVEQVIDHDRFEPETLASVLPVVLGALPHSLLVAVLAWGALLWSSNVRNLATVFFTGAVVLSLAFFPLTALAHNLALELLRSEGVDAIHGNYWVIFAIVGPMVAGGFFVLLRSAFRACHDVTRESLDRILEESALWLMIPSFLAGAVIALAYAIADGGYVAGALLVGCVAVFVAAIGASVAAGMRRIWRRKWFQRVRAGEVEGWRVVPSTDVTDELIGLPRLFDRLKNEDGALLRKRPGVESGAYRTGDAWEPWALVEIFEP